MMTIIKYNIKCLYTYKYISVQEPVGKQCENNNNYIKYLIKIHLNTIYENTNVIYNKYIQFKKTYFKKSLNRNGSEIVNSSEALKTLSTYQIFLCPCGLCISSVSLVFLCFCFPCKCFTLRFSFFLSFSEVCCHFTHTYCLFFFFLYFNLHLLD